VTQPQPTELPSSADSDSVAADGSLQSQEQPPKSESSQQQQQPPQQSSTEQPLANDPQAGAPWASKDDGGAIGGNPSEPLQGSKQAPPQSP
jgi:hypothetical protein